MEWNLILGFEMTPVQSEKWFAMLPTLSACVITEEETMELIVKGSVKQKGRARVCLEQAFDIARQTVIGSGVRSVDGFHCFFFRAPGLNVRDFHPVLMEDVLNDVARFVIRLIPDLFDN
jgi:hypothetical protein